MKRILTLIFMVLISAQAWATVPSATPLKNTYSCNSSTTQWSYGFPISATSDMTVYITDSSGNSTQVTTNFSVDTNNLWVVYPVSGTACATGNQITLIPSTPQTQLLSLTARSPFVATAIGGALDKLTLISQQLQGQLNRTILAPVNANTQTAFPSPSDGKVLGWTGGALVNLVPNTNAYITTSTDGTFAGNSDSLIPTQKATKTYVDTGLATKISAGANSSITSLTGLSTPLSTSQGGTGSVSSANTANGIVILNSSGAIPAMSGINLTNISGANFVSLASIPPGSGVIPSANVPTATSRYQMFTSSGTFVAPSGVTQIFLSGCGAGGAGGSSTGSSTNIGNGGNSGYCISNYPYTVIAGNSYTVTINAGGTGVSNADGNSGGTTVFDALTLNGGTGGKKDLGTQAVITPAVGVSNLGTKATAGATPGHGASTLLGAGGVGLSAGHAVGASALANTGAGGAGSADDNSSNPAGGAGGSGLIIVTY